MNRIDKNAVATLHQMLSASSTITIFGHTNPDGDAVGSCLAMQNYLESIGKDAEVVLPDPIPVSLHFILKDSKPLIFSEDEEEAKARIVKSDLIICQDFNGFPRVAIAENVLKESPAPKVLIDHHLSPDRDSFALVFSETETSSTCELLFYILMAMPEIGGDANRLPAECARDLMIGMTTDTNNFANSAGPETFAMASALLAAGVDRNAILADLYNSYRENRIRIMGALLKDYLKITEKGVAYIILTEDIAKEYDVQDGETEGFVNIPLSIAKVRMSIFLREEGGKFRVSIRSKKGTSANMCARTWFNGGGHEMAAGGKLFWPENIPSKEDAAEYIEKVTSEFLGNE